MQKPTNETDKEQTPAQRPRLDDQDIRTYIATAALQGILSAMYVDAVALAPDARRHIEESAPRAAVLFADALLAELEKPNA